MTLFAFSLDYSPSVSYLSKAFMDEPSLFEFWIQIYFYINEFFISIFILKNYVNILINKWKKKKNHSLFQRFNHKSKNENLLKLGKMLWNLNLLFYIFHHPSSADWSWDETRTPTTPIIGEWCCGIDINI